MTISGLPDAISVSLATHGRPGVAIAAMQPSEYTAALIQVLQNRIAWAQGADALEVGSGSGVVLAALGMLGATSLCGVEIEPTGIAAAVGLMIEVDRPAELHHGSIWEPVIGRRFDLIAANLPHFPMPRQPFGKRLPSWSSGGPDGRGLLNAFLAGLPEHLAPGGRAIITHNAFVDLAQTRDILAEHSLALRIALTVLVHIPREKLDLMTSEILRAEEGRSIHRYGPYAFANMHVVEIAEPAALV
ncbi:MAG TPA: hypothetical protein VMI30_04950 [Stellaceae bacterium]|nr:hypothetical protein [Stellaceae bacterium]